MSEYQYYEWQRLESPLSLAEQNAVDALSSHIEVSSMQASVSYNWGDFKHNPIKILAKYFDAYLYFANWGSYNLAFSFPKGLIDVASLEVYFDEEHVNITVVEDRLILKFEKQDEEGYCGDYEEQGHLSTLSRLRDDIIQGDYRVLYIAWLNAMAERSYWYEEDEDDPENFYKDIEPPIPAGLKELRLPLRTFVDAFEVDPFLISAAAERSPSLLPLRKTAFDSAINNLSRQEANDFLIKIANAEPGAVAALQKKLRSFDKPANATQSNPRTIGELLKRAKELKEIESKRLAEKTRKKYIARMKKLEKDEAQLWLSVERILTGGAKAKVYDEATEVLDKLYELAEYKGKGFRFKTQTRAFAKQYERRLSLIERWEKRGWV